MLRMKFGRVLLAVIAAWSCSANSAVKAQSANVPPGPTEIAARLMAAYPGIVKSVDGNDIVFSDGTKLPIDDGKGLKSAADWLENPDIKDMFRYAYPAGAASSEPAKDFDPGRARNEAFLTKVYGDCRKGGVDKDLVSIVWMPKKYGHKLKFTRINGAAGHLKAVSEDLDRLPARYNVDLFPTAGTFNCRVVAGTKAISAHSFGIAIDIALKHSSYWRWFLNKSGKPGAVIKYRNAIPLQIVDVFERHGFIWGGRWNHFDTMHFEYRPELLPAP